MLRGFKAFITGGNLIETAVALVMALAVVALVNALIADLITPVIGAIVGKPDFGDLTFTINDSHFLYGDFINAAITFISIGAAVYFFIVAPYRRFQEHRGVTADSKTCDRCLSDVPLGATRCPHCTSDLAAA